MQFHWERNFWHVCKSDFPNLVCYFFILIYSYFILWQESFAWWLMWGKVLFFFKVSVHCKSEYKCCYTMHFHTKSTKTCTFLPQANGKEIAMLLPRDSKKMGTNIWVVSFRNHKKTLLFPYLRISVPFAYWPWNDSKEKKLTCIQNNLVSAIGTLFM